jgi:TrmH family RNA methyltransferase
MITSSKNPKAQWVRRLQKKVKERQADGVFVIEGVRLLEEGLNSGWHVKSIFYTDDLGERGMNIVRAFQDRDTKVEVVSENVMRAISDTQNPQGQGILAVFEMHSIPLPERLNFMLILDQIREPGNLGTILRSAAVAGVHAVFLSPGTVDPFSPKVLRAGMGAHFTLPVHLANWNEIESQIKHSKLHPYLASVDGGMVYHQADFRHPLALIIGGEADGASDIAYKASDSLIHIPRYGEVESLNASVAAGILLFEIARQRENFS